MAHRRFFLTLVLFSLSISLYASDIDALDCTKVGDRLAWREGTWKLVPFPDTHAQYLSYQFLIPKKRKLSLQFKGEFPYALYTSFVVYHSDTEEPFSEVLDNATPVDADSRNPYKLGEDRYTKNRSYSVWAYSSGIKPPSEKGTFLTLPYSTKNDIKVDIWFRVYENEREQLPIPQIRAFDGEELFVGQCPTLAEKEYSIATEPDFIVGRRPRVYVKSKVPLPTKDRQAHMYFPDASSLGGNPHSQYLSMRLPVVGVPASMQLGPIKTALLDGYLWKEGMLQKEIGDVTVLRLKIPAFPDVLKGLPKFTGDESLRYWSLCLSGHDTSTSDCISGKTANVFRDAKGDLFSVVVIAPKTPELVYKTVSLGYDFIDRSSQLTPILFYRQMVTRKGFVGHIQKVKKYLKGEKEPATCYADKYIGDYAPLGKHFQQVEFLKPEWKMPELEGLVFVEER